MTSLISTLVLSVFLSANYPTIPRGPVEGLPGESPVLPRPTVLYKNKSKNYL